MEDRYYDVVYQPDPERLDLDATVAAILSRLREFDPHPYRIEFCLTVAPSKVNRLYAAINMGRRLGLEVEVVDDN